MKFCKDCKHCNIPKGELRSLSLEYAKCIAPQAMEVDFVSGGVKPKNVIYCSTQRDSWRSDSCGKEGAWFEPIQENNSVTGKLS